MSYLYQEIMKVPGLSGDWRKRQADLFKRLYPNDTYTGSYEQNIKLLNAIRSGNYGTATNTEINKDPIQKLAERFVKKNGTPSKSFNDLYGTEQEYVDKYKPVVQKGIEQQVNKYYAPQIDAGMEKIRTTLANRGLFRSGIRAKEENQFMEDIADKETQMGANLYANRERELIDRYNKNRVDYEKARREGQTYNYTPDRTVLPTPQINYNKIDSQNRYSRFGTSNTDTNRYLSAFRRWKSGKYGNRY